MEVAAEESEVVETVNASRISFRRFRATREQRTLMSHARRGVPLMRRVGEIRLGEASLLLLHILRLSRPFHLHAHVLIHRHLKAGAGLLLLEAGLLETRHLLRMVVPAVDLQNETPERKKRGQPDELPRQAQLEQESASWLLRKRRCCTLVRLADPCSSSSRERLMVGELNMVMWVLVKRSCEGA